MFMVITSSLESLISCLYPLIDFPSTRVYLKYGMLTSVQESNAVVSGLRSPSLMMRLFIKEVPVAMFLCQFVTLLASQMRTYQSHHGTR
jgi:hypothetical protein